MQWTDLVEGLSSGELWKHGLELGVWQKNWISRSYGEVSLSEGNSCTVKVVTLVSCHMWVEGDCSLQLYYTVLCWIFNCFTTVFLVLLVSLRTLHFFSVLCISVHIITYATYCQISVLNVTKIQYIYLLDEIYFYVFYINCRNFVVPCVCECACMWGEHRNTPRITPTGYNFKIVSYSMKISYYIYTFHWIKDLKLYKFKVLINHTTHITKFFWFEQIICYL